VRIFLLALTSCLSCAAQDGLIYSRIFPFLGSVHDTAITAMTSDAAGNIYLTGWTEEPSLPVTPGVVQPKFTGGGCTDGPNTTPYTCPDGFVVKLDANSNIVFATYLGGGYSQTSSIGLDAAGNIYVASITTGFSTLPGSKYTGGATFIVKLNPTGTAFLYTAAIPGTGNLPFLMPNGANTPPDNAVIQMVVDQAGNAYFTALGTSGFPVTANPIATKGGIVVGKLDPTGQNLIYATYLGGSGNDNPGAIAIDSAGDAYVTGSTDSPDFPTTTGVLQSTLPPGTASAFIVKLNPAGNQLIYGTYFGGPSDSAMESISVDPGGDAYVLGIGNIEVTAGAYQTTSDPGGAFVAKLNPGATALVYATYIVTHAIPAAILQVDAGGNAYVAGVAGGGFMASADALQPCRAGGADAFVLELAPDGKFTAATYLGGSGEDFAYALQPLSDGTVLLAGATNTSDFLVTPDSKLSAPGYFIAKFQIANAGNAARPCSILAPEDSANFQDNPVAPGELVTLWGLRFGPVTGAPLQFDSTGRIATTLAGVRVFFDGFAAPLLYAQSEQINTQVPWELAGKTTAQMHVEYNGVSTRTGIVTLQPSAPALFPAKYGAPQGAIINQDGTPNSPTNPAPAGSVVSIYGTGGGLTNPASVTGGIAPIKPKTTLELPTTVIIDDTLSVAADYAGVAPTFVSGLMQINLRIPQSLGPLAAHRVDVNIGNGSTQGMISVTIATK
jgi:uncharacterized protein (TIGR03437 family)